MFKPYNIYKKKYNMGMSCAPNSLNFIDNVIYQILDDQTQASDEDSDGVATC
jgi:hypothetical protein